MQVNVQLWPMSVIIYQPVVISCCRAGLLGGTCFKATCVFQILIALSDCGLTLKFSYA